jgi:formate hydrogenlyase subunit 3/multisubunit Na+/H+ antiporter MnhD subunit
MSAQRIETLTWVLIYGGIFGLCLGWFMTPQQGPWGELLISGGMVSAVVGIVLIVVRSRMKR